MSIRLVTRPELTKNLAGGSVATAAPTTAGSRGDGRRAAFPERPDNARDRNRRDGLRDGEDCGFSRCCGVRPCNQTRGGGVQRPRPEAQPLWRPPGGGTEETAMAPNDWGAARILSLALTAVLACGCTGGGATPSPTAPPAPPSPAPTPTPLPSPSASPFAFDIVPAEEPTAVRTAIPGERICFLGVFTAADLAAGPVTITATAVRAKVHEIVQPTSTAPIAEVWVVPDPSSEEATASVTFTAKRGTVVHTATRSIPVFPMPDERAADAQPHFAWWIAWLAAKHPELGITKQTKWTPRFVSTLLVVSHYAYDSDEWELNLLWHNMIPPDDWTEIQLRRRGTEAAPSIAFRQDSMKGDTAPHEVTPPPEPVR